MSIKIKGIENPVKAESPITRSLGHQQITDLSAAVNLRVPFGARRAFIQVLTKGVYWTEDNSLPSSTNGLEADQGDPINYTDGDYSLILPLLRFIEKAASAKLNIAYYD